VFCDALFLRFHGSCSRVSCLHVLGLLGSCFRIPSSRRSFPQTESQRQKTKRREREREEEEEDVGTRRKGAQGKGERSRREVWWVKGNGDGAAG